MAERIRAPQLGVQLDHDLRAILDALEAAGDNKGKVLYIRDAKIAFGDGASLFNIVRSTGG